VNTPGIEIVSVDALIVSVSADGVSKMVGTAVALIVSLWAAKVNVNTAAAVSDSRVERPKEVNP
jgi:hypothetical protein